MTAHRICLPAILLMFGFVSSASAVTVGQIDDFQDGTTQGWAEGIPSPNPPFNLANGGPLGAGDHALRNVSSNTVTAGGRMAMFNRLQWTGDYTAGVGVGSISGLMRADPGGSSLLMRVGVEGNPGERWVSTNAIALPNDGLWHPVVFNLTAADMTQVGGIDPLGLVLSNVGELRILHSTAPSWIAGVIPATLDVDNLTANPVPEPGSFVLLALAAVSLFCLRKRLV